MGCDIHSAAVDANGYEMDGKWADDDNPFGWRNYGVFAFLAGVRNYSGVVPFSEPRGLPDDMKGSEDSYRFGDHSFSWLSVAELTSFDYDSEMEDLRVTRQISANHWSGGETAEPGGGEMMSWRKFLGDNFFDDLTELQRIGADRVVFGFDS